MTKLIIKLFFAVYIIFVLINAGSTAQVLPSLTIEWDEVTLDTLDNPETEPLWYWIYCSTWPQFTPGEDNFLAVTAETSYEHFDARHADPSVNFFYYVIAVDLWGNRSAPSDLGGNYNFILASIKTQLQGPFLSAEAGMRKDLAQKGVVPLVAPYPLAARVAVSVPDSVVDWILLELKTTPQGAAVAQQSFFIKPDGRISEPDGRTTEIAFYNIPVGNYYVTVRHRNHIGAMSAIPVTLYTSDPVLYDFTAAESNYYGTGGCVNINGSGIWGLWAGDTDQTGTVDEADGGVVWNLRNNTGYLNGDTDMNGVVNARDRNLVYGNRGKTSGTP
ncbi:hypothetical protein JW935_28345 [candidate division KSB1 bacterium]|nr:hypothetical protein [candidate division KSB1 bacterium]